MQREKNEEMRKKNAEGDECRERRMKRDEESFILL